jgi:hypothetical protein
MKKMILLITHLMYEMGIISDAMGLQLSPGKSDKSMGYKMENNGVLQQAVGRRIRYHNTYTTLMTPWEDSIVPPIDVRK